VREACLPAALLALASVAGAADPPAGRGGGWRVEPFSIESPGSRFRIQLAGYAQADFRHFQDWTAGDEETGRLRAEEFEWRRLRIGFEGRFGPLSFELDVDPAFDEGDELKDAWLDLRLARELHVRGGHMKLPVSPEWLTSASRTDFVERSLPVRLFAPARDWGVMLHGQLGRLVEYQAGVFEGDGRTLKNRARTTIAGRLVLSPAKVLDLGGSFAQGDVGADPAGPDLDPAPRGLRGDSLTDFRFFAPLFVDGRRQRWGAEASFRAGPVGLRGEYLETRESRRGQGPTLGDLPEVVGRGWTVAATWLLTGERKVRTIRPEHALFGGPGAVELGVRYDEVRFDDTENEGFEGVGNRSRNIRPAGLRAITGGLSWWPTTWLRLMGDVVVERYDDPQRAPEPGREGDYVSFLGRVQVHIPTGTR